MSNYSQLKSFFPNFYFKLLRSNLAPNQQVFHTNTNFNKFDIKQLLTKMYGLEILDVRTMIYEGKRPRKVQGKSRGGRPAFKKVIVTMKDDFVFPDPPTVEDGALRIPPNAGVGRNSANHGTRRKEIQKQHDERKSL